MVPGPVLVDSRDATQGNQVINIDGRLSLSAIILRLTGVNAVGQRVDEDNLHVDIEHMGGKALGSRYAMRSLASLGVWNQQMPGLITQANATGGAVDMTWVFPFGLLDDSGNVLPVASNEHIRVALPQVASLTSGTWRVLRRERTGQARYILSTVEEDISIGGTRLPELLDNLVGLFIRPATGTNPDTLRLFRGDTQLSWGTWSDWIKMSGVDYDHESPPLIISRWFSTGRDLSESIQSGLTLEVSGGSGTLPITQVRLQFSPQVLAESRSYAATDIARARSRAQLARIPRSLLPIIIPPQAEHMRVPPPGPSEPTEMPVHPRLPVPPTRHRRRLRVSR